MSDKHTHEIKHMAATRAEKVNKALMLRADETAVEAKSATAIPDAVIIVFAPSTSFGYLGSSKPNLWFELHARSAKRTAMELEITRTQKYKTGKSRWALHPCGGFYHAGVLLYTHKRRLE